MSHSSQRRSTGELYETTSVSEVMLKEVYAPSGIEPTVDIVFVHGVQHPREKEWLTATWTHSSGTCWPRHLLPDALPDARIMMFGYRNQRPWDVFSGARFENAWKLLSMLHASRTTHAATRRPIIFVANNLGGLLVKQATVLAHSSREYAAMGQLLGGLLFFGVPHRGNNGVDYSDTIGNTIRALGGTVDGALIRALEDDMPHVERVNHDFLYYVAGIRLVSFYEGTRSNLLRGDIWKTGWAVDGTASQMGLELIREDGFAQQSDHVRMCKFGSEHDIGFGKAASSLQSLARRR